GRAPRACCSVGKAAPRRTHSRIGRPVPRAAEGPRRASGNTARLVPRPSGRAAVACHTCGVCGGLDGHWSHCQNSYSPSPSPYYDPPDIFYAHGNNEEEEHHAPMRNMEKLIQEHMEVMREQLTEQGGALKRLSSKLTEMMAETTTCNDLQVTVLANTQEEPQVEGVLWILSNAWKQEEESQPLDHSLLVDVDVEEVDKSEDVKHNAILELDVLVLILKTFRHCVWGAT
ncbi:hypothetical protein HAX54_005190, partial [Datura stramonium]|nr:hypothetical protein [Datura stramonium]